MFRSTRIEYLKNGVYIALTKPFRQHIENAQN